MTALVAGSLQPSVRHEVYTWCLTRKNANLDAAWGTHKYRWPR